MRYKENALIFQSQSQNASRNGNDYNTLWISSSRVTQSWRSLVTKASYSQPLRMGAVYLEEPLNHLKFYLRDSNGNKHVFEENSKASTLISPIK